MDPVCDRSLPILFSGQAFGQVAEISAIAFELQQVRILAVLVCVTCIWRQGPDIPSGRQDPARRQSGEGLDAVVLYVRSAVVGRVFFNSKRGLRGPPKRASDKGGLWSRVCLHGPDELQPCEQELAAELREAYSKQAEERITPPPCEV